MRRASAVATALVLALALLPAAPAHGAQDLRGRTIVLDPGHNGGNARHPAIVARRVWAGTAWKACDTAGTTTRGGYAEAAYTLDVARRLRRLLVRRGARVVLTRTTNDGVGPCIDRRAAIGNRARADVAVSIHADGGPAGGRGFHVIVPTRLPGLTSDIWAPSQRLGRLLRDAYRRGTGLPYATYVGRRGLDERGDLGGLDLSDVPKAFVETGNMRNALDARLLTRPAFRARVAAALAAGIAAFCRSRPAGR